MKYAYARVSTRKQSPDGNGIEEQIERLRSVNFDELIIEEFTGSVVKRPQLEKLLAKLQAGDSLMLPNLTD